MPFIMVNATLNKLTNKFSFFSKIYFLKIFLLSFCQGGITQNFFFYGWINRKWDAIRSNLGFSGQKTVLYGVMNPVWGNDPTTHLLLTHVVTHGKDPVWHLQKSNSGLSADAETRKGKCIKT